MGLGFKDEELNTIQAGPLHLSTAPGSWLSAMLADWRKWAPTDARGSKSYATLYSLRTAVSEAGLGQTAEKLDKLRGKH
jgi:hypothetical protein